MCLINVNNGLKAAESRYVFILVPFFKYLFIFYIPFYLRLAFIIFLIAF